MTDIDEIVKRYHNPCVQIDHSKWSTGEAVTDVMYEHETGQWVKYSDYTTLVAKVRELEKVAPLQSAKDVFIEAYRAYHAYIVAWTMTPDEEPRYIQLMGARDAAWNHLQQLKGERVMDNNDIASEGANTLSDVRRDPSPFIDHMSVKHQKFLSAIHLKVTHPDLPDWLNKMIDRSRRDDFARAALQGHCAAEWTKDMSPRQIMEISTGCANAMMEESK